MSESPLFDNYAETYDDELNYALEVTGADKEFFARKRIEWLSQCLEVLGEKPRTALDYGCGIGSTVPVLKAVLALDGIIGIDISARSIGTARKTIAGKGVGFATIAEHQPQCNLDLAYCNGVFHHIPKPERRGALKMIRNSLRNGGLFAFWENNPWSLATRYVMSRCAFDKDAETLSIVEASELLRECGFEIVRSDFLFIFPNFLKALQPLERFAHKAPLGAQYQILVRKN